MLGDGKGGKEGGRKGKGRDHFLEQDPTSQGFQYPHTGPLSWESTTQRRDPVGMFCIQTRKSWVLVTTLQKENSKEKGGKWRRESRERGRERRREEGETTLSPENPSDCPSLESGVPHDPTRVPKTPTESL